VFLVENYVSFRSYFTCQNEFRGTFPDVSVPKKSTVFRLVNRFLTSYKMEPGNGEGLYDTLSTCSALYCSRVVNMAFQR
jgi:hypothetical protein